LVFGLIWVANKPKESLVMHFNVTLSPELLVGDQFERSEGIAFNGEGRLFVTANRALWEITTDNETRKVADLHSNLGLAPIGDRDLLVADFGPTNAFEHDRNTDGMVWRITPEGEKTIISEGVIGDPNFIVMRKDGALLVSDDATADIWIIEKNEDGSYRKARIFTTAVNHPNGLVLTEDESTLYVAQIFNTIRPLIRDDRLWKIDLRDGKAVSDATLVTRTGPRAANDGLAMDRLGRIYIAANFLAGEVWRYDPKTGRVDLIAGGMYGSASIAFGEGEFDHQSIYVTTTFNGGRGGNIWRVPVGIEGAKLNR
jgi:sugar lactone lactonase YvrE